MNIIFLDVDGVLNINMRRRVEIYENTGYRCPEFDCLLISRIASIVEATDAKIVLTSSMRVLLDYVGGKFCFNSEIDNKLLDYLHIYNLDIYDVTSRIAVGASLNRGLEICDYLSKNNNINNYVIIDDEISDIDYIPSLVPHIVKVDNNYGILDNDVNIAIDILNKKKVLSKF